MTLPMTLHGEVDNWGRAILEDRLSDSDRTAPERESAANSTRPQQLTKRPTQYMTATWGS
jgi:hypothetical protein